MTLAFLHHRRRPRHHGQPAAPAPAPRRVMLGDATSRAADYASLASPCEACGVDHIGDCAPALLGIADRLLIAEQGGWPAGVLPYEPVEGHPPWDLAAPADAVALPEPEPELEPLPGAGAADAHAFGDPGACYDIADRDISFLADSEPVPAATWADTDAERIAEPHERMAHALHPAIVASLGAVTVDDALAQIFGDSTLLAAA